MTQRIVNSQGETHKEYKENVYPFHRSCTSHDIMIGGQCSHCLWTPVNPYPTLEKK